MYLIISEIVIMLKNEKEEIEEIDEKDDNEIVEDCECEEKEE